MKLKKIFKVLFIILSNLLFNYCSQDDVSNDNFNQDQNISCTFNYLKFDFLDKTAFGGSIAPSTDPTHFFEYNNDKIIKINGGLTPVSIFTGFNFIFINEAFDSIIYNGNDIKIIHQGFGGLSERVINFKLDSQNRIVEKVISNITNENIIYSTEEFVYSGNKISQIVNNDNDSGNKTEQNFFYENDNLIRTETLIENFAGIVTKRRIDTFEDFDNFKNPFKELFFLNGAFFRAQSKNNYTKHKLIEETLNTNTNQWIETINIIQNYQFEYFENDFPIIGEYNCNLQ